MVPSIKRADVLFPHFIHLYNHEGAILIMSQVLTRIFVDEKRQVCHF